MSVLTVNCGSSSLKWSVIDPPHTLVLHSTTHLPAAWRDRHGAGIDWTWTYHLTTRERRCTRLHLRVRGRTTPWWLTAAYHAALVPADLVMAVGMLRGIRRRAQAGLPWEPSGREPVSPAPPAPPIHGDAPARRAEPAAPPEP